MKKFFLILLLLPGLLRAQTIVKPIDAEYRSGFICSDGTLRAFNNGSSSVVVFPFQGGATSWVDGAGGFNSFRMIDNLGKIWTNRNDNTTNFTATPTDSAGATISDAWGIDAMADTYTFLRADSSVWMGGDDTLHLAHSTGGVQMRPIKISGALKFKKVLVGFFRIVGLTSTGDVYEWIRNSGNITPVQKTIPRPAIDIWTSHYDYAGCLIPNATGSQTMGYAYVWGSQFGAWQGTTSYAQPTNVMSIWGISGPLKQVCANWNATHVIDSLGRMYGNAYSNTSGELGNGTEFANKYTYSAPYSWTFTDGENPSGSAMVQIGIGTTWVKMWSNTFFTFYKFSQDASGNYYFWGRDKAMVSGRGYINNQEASYPNALDVTVPTLVTPLTATRKTYNFQLPTIAAGSNQTITTSSTTLTATGHPALLINAANSTDTLAYTPSSWSWTQLSGPACTITSPTSKSTTVTGMTTGIYTFKVLMTDNNGGTATGQMTVTAAVSTCNCLSSPIKIILH